MRRNGWLVIAIVAGMVWGGTLSVVAEEAKPAASEAPATEASAPSAPAAASEGTTVTPAPEVAPTAPVVPAPAAPELRPIVIKFSGELVQVNQQDAAQPVLTVRDRYGVTKEMVADPTIAKATKGAATVTLDDLKTGDQVSVEYTYDVASGKRHVQQLTVAEAPAAASTQQP